MVAIRVYNRIRLGLVDGVGFWTRIVLVRIFIHNSYVHVLDGRRIELKAVTEVDLCHCAVCKEGVATRPLERPHDNNAVVDFLLRFVDVLAIIAVDSNCPGRARVLCFGCGRQRNFLVVRDWFEPRFVRVFGLDHLLFFLRVEVVVVGLVFWVEMSSAAVHEDVGVRVDPVVQTGHVLETWNWNIAIVIRVFFNCSVVVFRDFPGHARKKCSVVDYASNLCPKIVHF